MELAVVIPLIYLILHTESIFVFIISVIFAAILLSPFVESLLDWLSSRNISP